MTILVLALWLAQGRIILPTVCKLSEPACTIPGPEPVDVPAVQEPTKKYPYMCKTMPTCPAGEMCEVYYDIHHPNGGTSTISGSDEAKAWQVPDCPTTKVKHYSCADKSRILEHDEHSPPKYWCRKIQQ